MIDLINTTNINNITNKLNWSSMSDLLYNKKTITNKHKFTTALTCH